MLILHDAEKSDAAPMFEPGASPGSRFPTSELRSFCNVHTNLQQVCMLMMQQLS